VAGRKSSTAIARNWIWHGGRPCLDLVNTLRERWSDAPRELLVEPADLGEWLRAAGLSARRPTVSPELLTEARSLREAIDRVLAAAAAGSPPRRRDVLLIDLWGRQAGEPPARLRLDRDGTLHVELPARAADAERALGAVAADAITLLAEGQADRVRVCGHARCGLRYLDRSPAGNRQWCSMRRCGGRAKAQQYYARKRRRSPGG
jgi:predicted RNA-binding Zn ribbon-like protein